MLIGVVIANELISLFAANLYDVNVNVNTNIEKQLEMPSPLFMRFLRQKWLKSGFLIGLGKLIFFCYRPALFP